MVYGVKESGNIGASAAGENSYTPKLLRHQKNSGRNMSTDSKDKKDSAPAALASPKSPTSP